MIRFIRGNPTPEELAAALAVVRARAAAVAPDSAARETLEEWADPARNVPGRSLPRPGPKAWRSSFWPR